MLNPAIAAIVYATEMLIAWIFFSGIATKRYPTFICWSVGLMLFEFGAIINLASANNLWTNLFITIIIHFSFASFCFQLRIVQGLLYGLVLTALSSALEFVVILSASVALGSELLAYNSDISLFIIECPTSKLLYLLTCLLIPKFVAPKDEKIKLPVSFYAYLMATICCIMIFWYVCLVGGTSDRGQFMLAIASLILFVSTVLLFITWQHEAENVAELNRIRSENNRMQIEENYYQILERQNQQLMAYAHDAKNHLAAIQSLNNDPRIDTYITQLNKELRDYSNKCHSGNKLLDVIIAKYQLQCENVDFQVKRCNFSLVEDIDLVAIFGNLLDNSVEAAYLTEKKQISLSTSEGNGYQILILSNSCDRAPETFNGNLMTSKEDHKQHGYGLKNVSRALKKYGGDFAWDYNELSRMFTVTVMIGEAISKEVIVGNMGHKPQIIRRPET